MDNEALELALGSLAAEHSLKSRVALRFEGINLPNLDKGSKTDAFCVLYSM